MREVLLIVLDDGYMERTQEKPSNPELIFIRWKVMM